MPYTPDPRYAPDPRYSRIDPRYAPDPRYSPTREPYAGRPVDPADLRTRIQQDALATAWSLMNERATKLRRLAADQTDNG